jgi:peptidoglycan hydrolase-like protein with peptidoglycan-binding domain
VKKFLITEEEKNRILDLYKKLISEQTENTNNSSSQGFPEEMQGVVSKTFFYKNKIDQYSDDSSSTGSSSSGGSTDSSGTSDAVSSFSWKETTLTIEDLKNGKTVSMGMKGPVVGEIQKLLIDKGYKNISKSGKPDNLFGRLTKAQVEKFQSENKDDKGDQLKKDGIVGPKTINALLNVPIPYTKGVETAVKQVIPTGISPTLPSPAKQ